MSTKLSPSQHAYLLSAKLGMLRAEFGGWSGEEGRYWESRPWWFHWRVGRNAGVETASCRALFRRGLIELDPQHDGYMRLTEAGEALWPVIETDEDRAEIAKFNAGEERERQRVVADAKMRALNDRQQEWRKQHREVLEDFQTRHALRRSLIQAAESELRTAALEIGRGANDLDGLLAELRRCTAEIDRLKQEEQDDRQAEAALRRTMPGADQEAAAV